MSRSCTNTCGGNLKLFWYTIFYCFDSSCQTHHSVRHRGDIYIYTWKYIIWLNGENYPARSRWWFTTYFTFTGLPSETRDDECCGEAIEPARRHGPTPSERSRGVARPRGASRFIDFLDEAAQPRGAHEAISQTPRLLPGDGRGAVAMRLSRFNNCTIRW